LIVKSSLVTTALVLVLCSSARGQEPAFETQICVTRVEIASDSSARVVGRVVSAKDGQPIESAQVFFTGTDVGRITDALGTFTLPPQQPGEWDLTFRSMGYTEERFQLTLRRSTITQVLLAARPLKLRQFHETPASPADTVGIRTCQG
jgi:hypothetical protein